MLLIQTLTIVFVVLLYPSLTLANCGTQRPGKNDDNGLVVEQIAQIGKAARIRLDPLHCALDQTTAEVPLRGANAIVPCRLVSTIHRHLDEISHRWGSWTGNIDHAHLAVPLEHWQSKYRQMPPQKILAALLYDPSLVIIYHPRCPSPKATTSGPGTNDRRSFEVLTVVGFSDGRPIAGLPYPRSDSPLKQSQYFHLFAWINLAAHQPTGSGASNQPALMRFAVSLDLVIEERDAWPSDHGDQKIAEHH